MEVSGEMVVTDEEMERFRLHPRALIDGDIILYACGFASQHTWYYCYPDDAESDDDWVAKYKYKKEAEEWVNGQQDILILPKVEVDSKGIAINNVKSHIKRIQQQTSAYDNYVIYFSDSKLDRDDIATLQKYKGNRDNMVKPFWYKEIKEYIKGNYKCLTMAGLEADDLMAISQENDGTTIICTLDKDLDMVPGLRYKDGKIYEISERDGQLAFYTQLLTGDATDNIPGLFKLTGIKASSRFKKGLFELDSDADLYAYVRKIYLDAFGCTGELSDIDVVLLEIGRLLWMKRDLDVEWEIPT